jgi:flagellin
MERLSSGQRINSAADDAAGLAIRDKMTAQVEGLNQAVRNANDAISFMQSAEGALEETTNILQRMRTLAVQAVNDTNSTSDRANLNDEIGKLQAEITRIGNTSTFNDKNLIDGTMTNSTFQIGHKTSQTISVALNDMRASAIGAGTSAVKEVETIAFNNAVASSADVKITLTDANGIITSTTLTATAAADGDALADLMAAKTVTGYSLTSNNDGTLSIENDTANLAFTAVVALLDTGTSTAFTATATTLDAVVYNTTAASAGAANAVAEEEVVVFTGAGASTSDVSITMTDANGAAVTSTITATAFADGDALADLFVAQTANIAGYTLSSSNNGTLTVVNNTANVAFTVTVASVLTGTSTATTATTATLNSSTYNKTAAAAGAAGTFIDNISVLSGTSAATAITAIDNALQTVGQERAKLGAFQNRLTHAVNNMTNMSANTSAAKSIIADADYASESSSLAKNQILQQAGTAMLAQANAQAQSVLSLLK